jgi:hypothetical protein
MSDLYGKSPGALRASAPFDKGVSAAPWFTSLIKGADWPKASGGIFVEDKAKSLGFPLSRE